MGCKLSSGISINAQEGRCLRNRNVYNINIRGMDCGSGGFQCVAAVEDVSIKAIVEAAVSPDRKYTKGVDRTTDSHSETFSGPGYSLYLRPS